MKPNLIMPINTCLMNPFSGNQLNNRSHLIIAKHALGKLEFVHKILRILVVLINQKLASLTVPGTLILRIILFKKLSEVATWMNDDQTQITNHKLFFFFLQSNF